ncbi:MAG: hypothetical protein ACKOW3_02870 [Hyphomicrobium sp.]
MLSAGGFMCRLCRFILLFIFMQSLTLQASEKKSFEQIRFPSSEILLKWINDYRNSPKPQLLPQAIHAMVHLGVLKDLDQTGVYVGFAAGVLGSNPNLAKKLVEDTFPLAPEDQVILIKAIAFSGLDDWKDLLTFFTERMPARKVLIEKYLYGDGKTLFELPLDQGSFVLDAHWGYYFASGSEIAVSRILSALEWADNRDNVERLTIAAMAKWTLASNGMRDKNLLDLLKSEMNLQKSEKIRVQLREVILAAETYETGKIRKDALAAIEEVKTKGPESARKLSWWGQAGQTALALGCVAAGVMGQVQLGIPCVVGGALSTAALKYLTPQ